MSADGAAMDAAAVAVDIRADSATIESQHCLVPQD
jgi:hypothetical protein